MGVKATARLEKLFDHAQPAIKLFQGLTEKVEDGPFAREEKLSLTRETIGGLPISFSGRAIASAAIHPVNQAVSIFEFGAPPSAAPQPPEGLPALPGSEEHSEPAKPPRGQAYTELGLFLGAEISAATNAISNQTLTLALAAAASGSVSYRLLLPAESGATKLEAGARLLVRARPPHRLDLRKLEKGELHTFDSRMLLGFAVSVKAGEELEIAKTLELFDDVSLALRAHATATLEASFGLALYDRLQLAVGRANVAMSGIRPTYQKRSDTVA